MPMLILAMRVETEIIFKMNYRVFLGNKGQSSASSSGPKAEDGPEKPKGSQNYSADIVMNQDRILRLINGIITEIFDPNIFFSRLSFLESGKDAIDIKTLLNQGRAHHGYKQPNILNKFYTRSALIKNLIPRPSDGKVRAMYGENKEISYPRSTASPSKLSSESFMGPLQFESIADNVDSVTQLGG